MPGETARAKQFRILQLTTRNKHARRQHRDGRGVSGNLAQRAHHFEELRAEFDLLPHLDAELGHEGFFENRDPPACRQLIRSRGGNCLEQPIKRIPPLQRPQRRQPRRVVGLRENDHGRQRNFRRLLTTQLIQCRRDFRRKRHAALDSKIGPQQGLGLIVDCGAQVGIKRPDRHQSRHAKDNRKRSHHQTPPRSARIPPSHFENEIHQILGTTKYTKNQSAMRSDCTFGKCPKFTSKPWRS